MASVIVLDYGTSALKAALYNERFERVALESRAWKYDESVPGQMEIAADEYWRAAVSAVRALLKGDSARDVIAISVTGQAETMLALNERGEALRPAIVWLDTRAQAQCAEMTERVSAHKLYELTGNPAFDPVMPMLKQMWLKQHEPEIYARARRFLLLKEYIVYLLTGEIAGEATVNSLSGYFNINTRAWDAELLAAAELDARKLPEPLDSLAVVGRLTKRAQADLGLSGDVRVVNGMLDQCASALGAGNAVPGKVCETTGTALAIAATFPRFEPRALPERVAVLCHAFKDRFLALPNCPTAGAALEWFRDKMLSGEERAAGFKYIDARVAERLSAEECPIFLPHLCGRLSPRPNLNLRGSIHNITLQTDRFLIARAIMEGVTFLIKQNLGLLSACGARAKELISLGGGARSDIWLQMKADALEMPVTTLIDTESTALGCALGAGLALGMIPDEAALRDFIRVNKSYSPDIKRFDIYRARYEAYEKLDA